MKLETNYNGKYVSLIIESDHVKTETELLDDSEAFGLSAHLVQVAQELAGGKASDKLDHLFDYLQDEFDAIKTDLGA